MVSDWYVYIIEADDGTLYTGITTDLGRRWREHRKGGRGARYFRGRQPRAYAYVEGVGDRAEASRREAAIKRLRRVDKLALIAAGAGTLPQEALGVVG